jgi:hypothetical protein
MTNPLPILSNGSSWQPGTCMACNAPGVVLHDPTDERCEYDGSGCCPACCTKLWDSMTDNYEPRVDAPYREW